MAVNRKPGDYHVDNNTTDEEYKWIAEQIVRPQFEEMERIGLIRRKEPEVAKPSVQQPVVPQVQSQEKPVPFWIRERNKAQTTQQQTPIRGWNRLHNAPYTPQQPQPAQPNQDKPVPFWIRERNAAQQPQVNSVLSQPSIPTTGGFKR